MPVFHSTVFQLLADHCTSRYRSRCSCKRLLEKWTVSNGPVTQIRKQPRLMNLAWGSRSARSHQMPAPPPPPPENGKSQVPRRVLLGFSGRHMVLVSIYGILLGSCACFTHSSNAALSFKAAYRSGGACQNTHGSQSARRPVSCLLYILC